MKKRGKPKPSLESLDFYYKGVCDIDYHTQAHCEEADCDDICRCRTIEDAIIGKNSISLQKVVQEIGSYFNNLDPIFLYCVERILVCHKYWENEFWNINICRGYYGEEIDTVNISNTLCCRNLYELSQLTNSTEQIEYVLNLEYDNLLPELKNLSWSIVLIKKSKIKFGAKDHRNQMIKKDLNYYKNHSGPLGIVVGENRLIDGYHRLTAHAGDFVEILYGVNK